MFPLWHHHITLILVVTAFPETQLVGGHFQAQFRGSSHLKSIPPIWIHPTSVNRLEQYLCPTIRSLSPSLSFSRCARPSFVLVPSSVHSFNNQASRRSRLYRTLFGDGRLNRLMAASDGCSTRSAGIHMPEASKISNPIRTLPRRQLTLIGVTVCLNILLWSSIFVLITSFYVIASDPTDTTNIPTHVLTLLSSVGSIGYVVLHTVFSLKQRIWRHQKRHPSITKMTSYVAVRVAVSITILWLLTSGWNMITVARQPICLPARPGLEGWEAGGTCVVSRVAFAVTFIALRPFEAHVFKSAYLQSTEYDSSPALGRRSSASRSTSFGSGRYGYNHIPASIHRSSPSNVSNADVETLDLNSSTPPPSMIHAPAPIRSIGLGIFTSQAQPPPLPAAYVPSRKASPFENEPPIFQPSASYHHLPQPPRMTTLVTPSGFVPLSVPMQYPASAWRAVHPMYPSPLGQNTGSQAAAHSHTAPGRNFSYRSGYSRSSISLTRPHRLSTATPPGGSGTWSSRSCSSGPGDDGRSSPLSGGASRSTSGTRQASSDDIAYAILNGTAIPGLDVPRVPYVAEHSRSASAPDATCGAQEDGEAAGERKAKGWKPSTGGGRYKQSSSDQSRDTSASTDRSFYHSLFPRSSSADLFGRPTADSGLANVANGVNRDAEKESEIGLRIARTIKEMPFRKSRSATSLRPPQYPTAPSSSSAAAATAERQAPPPVISRMPQRPRIQKKTVDVWGGAAAVVDPDLHKMTTLDKLKNKPLPAVRGA
ncbi:hypothetical protein BU24DRAFT_446225 [Aaosphaeria arxii CBS 175.79]|uniref:Uncharacterized protein n=1 Tax=Aaosphaeria arxii CBS 175.79 TaxID=1450172 RepID=A0A6A5Y6H8_9PLEO|nr:uncharacterized protein BU24DRAFT_446225 [Aaosphaeria arxii CBS 175.79]KAF2021138.1 hypothetical protein BU24DRAFT_446225 [Aaosphaeria arxii CBS 175.79]